MLFEKFQFFAKKYDKTADLEFTINNYQQMTIFFKTQI